MKTFAIPSSSKQAPAGSVATRFFVTQDGKVCLKVQLPDADDRYAVFVELGGEWQGSFFDKRHGGLRMPSVVPLETTRVDIEVRRCERRIAQDVRIGSLVVTDAGTVLIAKSWDSGEQTVAVNIHTGEFILLQGASSMLIEAWTMRAYLGDTVIFEAESDTPAG
jgi:hypothetical protein